jgi:hypothetical protein
LHLIDDHEEGIMQQKSARWLLTLLMAVTLVTGCGDKNKVPADAAIKAAEIAVSQAKEQAAKLVPDQVKGLEDALAAAKDKFGKGDFAGALADASALPEKAKSVLAAAQAKKDELTKDWTSMSEGLPKTLEAIKSRVDILSQSKKLPANVSADKLEAAKTALTSATAEWTKAQDNFKSGAMGDAVAAVKTVKENAVKALEALAMPVPPALKS